MSRVAAWIRQPPRHPWVRVAISAVSVLVIYYAIPLRVSGAEVIGPAALTMAGVVVLAWVIVAQVRRSMSDQEVRLPFLASLATLVLAVFAFGYYALETLEPGQMAQLETRTDALYFTLQVLTTVGLGDVHAVGQTARAMVAVQMVFDLVFVAAGGSVLVSAVRDQMSGRPHAAPTGENAPADDVPEARMSETKEEA
ncbi:potassium channel family protein [Nocardioides sp. YIM 152588]|uniref:potassium channel family protein n=1 Tax=Nocardioides sp. YIM 152588 TaxID=3158259 RepID=UPI0032E37412